MNKPNNQRRRESQRKMERAFIQLLQNYDLSEITVTEICKLASVNRTTFYANYMDIYDLADAIQSNLEQEVANLYSEEYEHQHNSNNYLKLFRHIYENQIFYRTYFKLGADARFKAAQYDIHMAAALYDNKHIDYHMEFFRQGLNGILRMWLNNGCKESPEEIAEILRTEYSDKIVQ